RRHPHHRARPRPDRPLRLGQRPADAPARRDHRPAARGPHHARPRRRPRPPPPARGRRPPPPRRPRRPHPRPRRHAPPHPPPAPPATTADDTPVTTPVLANDPAPDGDVLTVVAVTPGARGAVAIGPGGLDVTYTPAPHTSGPDAFAYTISDGRGGTASATVAV